LSASLAAPDREEHSDRPDDRRAAPAQKAVGILTIDPTSPFTGGALLGDRLRMREHFLDESVFIRSLATRGGHDGLSGCLCAAVQVLDAMGKDYVLIETIGIGQDQIGIAGLADTVLVIVTPESGDEVQDSRQVSLRLQICWSLTKPIDPAPRSCF
jgi:LAO/AO transport system kinase